MSRSNPSITSDEDRNLERRVTAFLAARNVPALRRLYVRSSQGVVTLRGHVHTFYEKQLGGHSARRVAGVVRVIDNVEVTPAAERRVAPHGQFVSQPLAIPPLAQAPGGSPPLSAVRLEELASWVWEGP